MRRIKPIQLLLLFLLLIAGCARIPAESVELSQQLGSQIDQLEQTHMALLNSFFADKQRQVDHFIKEEWTPEFSRNFFNNPQIATKWEQVSRSADAADRQQFLNTVGPIAQQKITEKRLELLGPLNDTERQLRGQLQQSYLTARNINGSLTRLLSSAAALTQKQQQYQQQLGIDNNKFTAGLNKIDLVVAQLLDTSEAASNQADKAQAYLENLKKLRTQLTETGDL